MVQAPLKPPMQQSLIPELPGDPRLLVPGFAGELPQAELAFLHPPPLLGNKREIEMIRGKEHPDTEEMDRFEEITPVVTSYSVDYQLIRAAILLVNDGNTKASATEIAGRVRMEFGTQLQANVVGQHLSALGIGSTVSRGVSRVTLDITQLSKVQKRLLADHDQKAAAIEEAVKEFDLVAEELEALESRYKYISDIVKRKTEIKAFLARNRGVQWGKSSMELSYKDLKQKLDRQEWYKTQIAQTEEQLKDASDLQPRLEELGWRN